MSKCRYFELLIGLGTLAVGIASLIIALNQEKIVAAQYKAQKEEHISNFQIDKYLADNDSTECFKLIVVNNSPRANLGVRTQTYYKIDEIITTVEKYEILKTYYVPVDGYYASHGGPYSLTGVIVNDSTKGNMSDYLYFKRECLKWSMSEANRSYSCDKIDFIIVEYLDTYRDTHCDYYEGTTLSTKDRYEDVKRLSQEAFKTNCYHRETITLKDVFGHLDGDGLSTLTNN